MPSLLGRGTGGQNVIQLVSRVYPHQFQGHSNRLVFLGKAIPLVEY